MNKIIAIVFSCSFAALCHAQELTLQACVEAGVANNLQVCNARMGIEKGQFGVQQSKARLLPIVNGSFQLTGYLKSPVNVTTGTLLGNDFPDNVTWQTIKSMPLNANAGIGAEVALYNQSLLAAIQVARTVEQLNTITYEKAVDDLTVQIGKVYYMAQALQEQERLASENVQRMQTLCNITQHLYEQGVVMEVDLNRVRINLKNLEAQHDQCNVLYCQQLNLLRLLIDWPSEKPLSVSQLTTLPDTLLPTANPYANLPEVRLASQQRQLAEQRIKMVKAGYLPSLSLSGYVGGLAYQEKLGNFFHTKAATNNWFGNSFIALSLRVPLFDAKQKRLQIKQYKVDEQQALNNAAYVEKQVKEQYDNAQLQLNHNMQVFRTQQASQQQAQQVYSVTEEQYKEGVASMTSLLQDEMQLRVAQTACVQALCQCWLARLDLLKLSGNLHVLK